MKENNHWESYRAHYLEFWSLKNVGWRALDWSLLLCLVWLLHVVSGFVVEKIL